MLSGRTRYVIGPLQLAQLRDTVLKISVTRCPKWHFRLREDVVFQLQPRPKSSLFDGLAIQGEGITYAHFAKPLARAGRGFMTLNFDLRAHGEHWKFVIHSGPAQSEKFPAAQALKDTIVAGMASLDQLTDALMFRPACVLCGKGLTDPVSMARWIGPECAHNHTLNVGVFKVPNAS